MWAAVIPRCGDLCGEIRGEGGASSDVRELGRAEKNKKRANGTHMNKFAHMGSVGSLKEQR